MAKILCGISGVEFTCQYVPMQLNSREYVHPIFALKQKELERLYNKYKYNELDDTSSYLLFLAYLNSTNLIEWRVPAQYHSGTEAIIANNFQHLVRLVGEMNAVMSPSLQFARISISPDTKRLDNVAYWLASWESSLEDFYKGNRIQAKKRSLAELESRLEYIIKDPDRKEEILAARLADWAAKAASFPRNMIKVAGETIQCTEHWKHIIRKCINEEAIFSVERETLQAIIEHCEQNLELGSIYTYNLLNILNKGLRAQSEFCGLQGFDFTILDDTMGVEQQNILVIASSAGAGTGAPQQQQYSSKFAYLKAKVAWEFSQEISAASQKAAADNLNI